MRALLLTYTALLALLAMTVGLSYLPMGTAGLPASLLIAAAKAVLVMAVFMRLREGSTLIRVTSLTGLVWLSLLFLLSFADYLTRGD